MRRLQTAILAYGIGISAAAAAVAAGNDLAAALPTGKWVFDHGEPPFQDRHVYAFARDGRYTYQLLTDHPTPTVTGRWKLIQGPVGKVRLRLDEQKGQKEYYWLAQESFIRYDPKRDVLLVSGERYAGEPALRHVVSGKE